MKKSLLFIAFVAVMAPGVFADIPNTLNYQGRLMDQAGQPVLDGQYTVTFRLYTATSGGNMVWEEQQTVATQNGYFNSVLGNTIALTPSMFSQPLWVGMQVGSNPEMTPRQKLGTSAYAMTVADGAITADKVAKGWGMVPAGSIVMWPMNTPPNGWLECEGQILSQSTYPALFNAIGTTYGGSGSDFNLPDYRGYFLRGWDHGAGNDPNIDIRTDRGDGITGDMVGTKQADQLKAHRHDISIYNCPDSYPGGGNAGTWSYPYGGGSQYTTDYAGDDETRPKNINVMYIIKY